MNEREKFLFDLRGYLRVENFLTPEEVQGLNEAVDANHDKYTEDTKMYGPWHGRRVQPPIYDGDADVGTTLVPTIPRSDSPPKTHSLPQCPFWSWMENGS